MNAQMETDTKGNKIVSDTEEIETSIEELDRIVAPQIPTNHNETFVRD